LGQATSGDWFSWDRYENHRLMCPHDLFEYLVINTANGDWVRRESGVGAGIDSYYEYLLKAYILLGDEEYLDRFNIHYTSIKVSSKLEFISRRVYGFYIYFSVISNMVLY